MRTEKEIAITAGHRLKQSIKVSEELTKELKSKGITQQKRQKITRLVGELARSVYEYSAYEDAGYNKPSRSKAKKEKAPAKEVKKPVVKKAVTKKKPVKKAKIVKSQDESFQQAAVE